MTVGVFHQVYNNKKASEYVIQNFRKHHPHEPYTLVCDGGVDHSDLAEKYTCNNNHYYINLGRPGHQKSKLESEVSVDAQLAFNREETLVWLDRFHEACVYSLNQGYSHIIMLEDDVLVTNKITIDSKVDFSGAAQVGNKINQKLIDYLKSKYDANFNVDYYSCCGGTIFNAEIFHRHYEDILPFIGIEFDTMFSMDHRIGWLDFYMQIIYHMLGCTYQPNPYYTERWNPEYMSSKYQIVNQFKDFY